jgi:hypothetical protein
MGWASRDPACPLVFQLDGWCTKVSRKCSFDAKVGLREQETAEKLKKRYLIRQFKELVEARTTEVRRTNRNQKHGKGLGQIKRIIPFS